MFNKTNEKQMVKIEVNEINVCEKAVRNQLNEIGFTYRKDKEKSALTLKQKK